MSAGALGTVALTPSTAVAEPAADKAKLETDIALLKRVVKEYYHARYEGKPDPEVLKDISKRLKEKVDAVTDVFNRRKAITEAYSQKLSAAANDWVKGKNVRTPTGMITLEGHLKPVVVDASTGHVVAYIKWDAGERIVLEEQACLAAKAIAQASTNIDTIALGGVKGGDDNAVFTAKISREAADRIKHNRIDMMADKRYIRLFEEVKFK